MPELEYVYEKPKKSNSYRRIVIPLTLVIILTVSYFIYTSTSTSKSSNEIQTNLSNDYNSSSVQEACEPKTCNQLEYDCDNWSDGCDGTLYCGSCDNEHVCQHGVCFNKTSSAPNSSSTATQNISNITCSCSWTNSGCGLGNCVSNQMKQTKQCVPDGCQSNTRCVSDCSCNHCIDGLKNCDETGLDCGGSSCNICTIFNITAGIFNGTGTVYAYKNGILYGNTTTSQIFYFNSGDVAGFNATPNYGYNFDYWQENTGSVYQNPTSISVNSTSNSYINAYFIGSCVDGTSYGQCSSIKPSYCKNGTLISNCSTCGCSSGTCQIDGTCKVLTCSMDQKGKILNQTPCLCGSIACSSGYCCNARICQNQACGSSIMNFHVLILRDISFYIVGDECTDGNCCNIYQPGYQTTAMTFENNANYKTLNPSDPSVGSYSRKMLMNLTLSDSDIQNIESETSSFISMVKADSGGSIEIIPIYLKIPHSEITLDKIFDCDLYVSPQNIKSIISIPANVDFTMTVSGAYDSSNNACFSKNNYCGLANGAGWWGLYGAGNDYVPFNGQCSSYNCANTKTFYHEWLHLFDSALENVMNINDIYHDNFPQSLCGNADSDPLKWFPSADTAGTDPDFNSCSNYYGSGWTNYCNSILPLDCDYQWDKHLLSVHYDHSTSLIGNYCRNGVKDFDETGIDCGGSCQSC